MLGAAAHFLHGEVLRDEAGVVALALAFAFAEASVSVGVTKAVSALRFRADEISLRDAPVGNTRLPRPVSLLLWREVRDAGGAGLSAGHDSHARGLVSRQHVGEAAGSRSFKLSAPCALDAARRGFSQSASRSFVSSYTYCGLVRRARSGCDYPSRLPPQGVATPPNLALRRPGNCPPVAWPRPPRLVRTCRLTRLTPPPWPASRC